MESSLEGSVAAGVELELGDCKGLGYEVCGALLAATALVTYSGSKAHITSMTRSSALTYDYGFTFNSEIATSTDPLIAGHPSDVIVGGGVDLVVREALKGT